MAGTMPHAVFVETDWDGSGGVAAYAAELPGCAAFASTADAAVAALPARVNDFIAWLNRHGESLGSFAGGNWYEVERVAATKEGGRVRRAAFSLDELPPSSDEFARYLRWLELAREELAEALDRADAAGAVGVVAQIERQDRAFVVELGGADEGDHDAVAGTTAADAADDVIDRLFAARDRLSECLEAAGPSHEGVRRIVRLAIADDLRAAQQLRDQAPR